MAVKEPTEFGITIHKLPPVFSGFIKTIRRPYAILNTKEYLNWVVTHYDDINKIGVSIRVLYEKKNKRSVIFA